MTNEQTDAMNAARFVQRLRTLSAGDGLRVSAAYVVENDYVIVNGRSDQIDRVVALARAWSLATRRVQLTGAIVGGFYEPTTEPVAPLETVATTVAQDAAIQRIVTAALARVPIDSEVKTLAVHRVSECALVQIEVGIAGDEHDRRREFCRSRGTFLVKPSGEIRAELRAIADDVTRRGAQAEPLTYGFTS